MYEVTQEHVHEKLFHEFDWQQQLIWIYKTDIGNYRISITIVST